MASYLVARMCDTTNSNTTNTYTIVFIGSTVTSPPLHFKLYTESPLLITHKDGSSTTKSPNEYESTIFE